jgi:aconitase A
MSTLPVYLHWTPNPNLVDIPFMPARVLMQDFTGVPAVVDISVYPFRSTSGKRGTHALINPQVPADLMSLTIQCRLTFMAPVMHITGMLN